MPVEPTERELQILKILWARGEGTVREVYEEMSRSLPIVQNTVQAFLRTMEEKGLVRHRVAGRTFIYSPVPRDSATKQKMMSRVLHRVFDGAIDQLVQSVLSLRQPTAEEWTALRFAWRVCAHVKSNSIVFTGADRTLAVGAGQMSRVDSVKVAVMKAAPGSLKGSVVASDAFFPFRDGLDAVADAGATAVVQPGGSVKDAEVIAAADARGLAMVFTGRRHFRH